MTRISTPPDSNSVADEWTVGLLRNVHKGIPVDRLTRLGGSH